MTQENLHVDVNRLSVGISPHVREPGDVSRIMWTVVLALIPIGVGALFLFGWYAGLVALTCVVSCVVSEAVWQMLVKKPVTVADGSAVITGLLLAYILPPNAPLFVAIVSSVFSIVIAKQLFGGLGFNIWNPALAGRAFVQIAYPAIITPATWPRVTGVGFNRILQDVRNFPKPGMSAEGFDAVSVATPLNPDALATFAPDPSGAFHPMYPSLKSLFIGNIPGCIGETSALLIILGGLFLIYKGYVNWKVPAVYLGMLFVFAFFVPSWKVPGSGAFGGLPAYGASIDAPGRFFFPLYQLFSGGVMLGAFFMATDMVTTPVTSRGQVIFALGCALITGAIRILGRGFPEGCCYSILLMNTATPIIDRYTRPVKYGAVKK